MILYHTRTCKVCYSCFIVDLQCYELVLSDTTVLCYNIVVYRMAGKFGRETVWQFNSYRAFGEKKFGELID